MPPAEATTVFVSNLAPNLTADDILDLFSKLGTVVPGGVKQQYDVQTKETGFSVQFAETSAARMALDHLDGLKYKSTEPLKVSSSVYKKSENAPSAPENGAAAGGAAAGTEELLDMELPPNEELPAAELIKVLPHNHRVPIDFRMDSVLVPAANSLDSVPAIPDQEVASWAALDVLPEDEVKQGEGEENGEEAPTNNSSTVPTTEVLNLYAQFRAAQKELAELCGSYVEDQRELLKLEGIIAERRAVHQAQSERTRELNFTRQFELLYTAEAQKMLDPVRILSLMTKHFGPIKSSGLLPATSFPMMGEDINAPVKDAIGNEVDQFLLGYFPVLQCQLLDRTGAAAAEKLLVHGREPRSVSARHLYAAHGAADVSAAALRKPLDSRTALQAAPAELRDELEELETLCRVGRWRVIQVANPTRLPVGREPSTLDPRQQSLLTSLLA